MRNFIQVIVNLSVMSAPSALNLNPNWTITIVNIRVPSLLFVIFVQTLFDIKVRNDFQKDIIISWKWIWVKNYYWKHSMPESNSLSNFNGKWFFSCLVGDRTKHLKNIHGVMKTTNTSNSTDTNNESSALNNSGNGSNIINHRASPFIVEDTSSSISSFQSTSDQSSLAGSLVESPTKTEPIESNRFELMNPNMNTTETVTMTLEEISQFAQNIY